VPRFQIDALLPALEQVRGQIGWEPQALSQARRRELIDFERFLRDVVPDELLQIGFEQEFGIPRLQERRYQRFLHERFKGDAEAMRREYGEDWEALSLVPMPKERVAYRNWMPPQTPRYRDYLRFKQFIRRTHPEMLQSFNGDVAWQRHLRNRYEEQISILNEQWGTHYTSFAQLRLPPTRPDRRAQAEAWDDFVRRKWSPRHMRWDASITPLWQQYLRSIYQRRANAQEIQPGGRSATAIDLLNVAHGSRYGSFDEVPLPTPASLIGQVAADFFGFIRGESGFPQLLPDTRLLRLVTLNDSYRCFLKDRFTDLAGVNVAYDRQYRAWDDIVAPMPAFDWWKLKLNTGRWRRYLAGNNFRLVLDRILLHGDALANTLAFVVLTIALQLTVNPLCAYALSRFESRHTGKVLLLLLATMAFPAEVTMIPAFLLLRDLDLLNTFAALLLPAAASGFSIFILKGFFDTLPREMYEAAQLDGAGELRMFAQITVPLCRPVMAYIALIAFMSAYTTFLFAMVVCQDSRLWTLMVWIYQLQGTVHESAQMAALLVVMLPTLLVLTLCQKIIMRGIVLPQLH
ncbi:MAG TPA: carbohydrate ABC transporter permease, partial [Tepidisphaeraceae bacterium]|nr:carbohydrate ABC transporter permease [Tepidisphaeraceae bacterium]